MLRLNVCAAAPGLAVALLAFTPIAAAQAAPPAQEQAQDPAARLESVQARWNKAQEDFYAKYQAAKTNEERRALMEQMPKASDYLQESLEVADAAQGTGVAARAWMWVLQLAPQAQDMEAMVVAVETLVREHIESPEIAELPMMIQYMSDDLGAEKSESMLRELVAKASEGAVKGSAMFALASVLGAEGVDPASERGKEARALMEAVARDYADVKGAFGPTLGAQAAGWIFEQDHLQVGKTAPEIEGTDLSGVAFKLSDYRGKVVLLDFWGNW